MKTFIKIFILLFVLSSNCFSQTDKEKIEAYRVSFISKRLELSIIESEKFWPVYNEYLDKVKALKKNLRQNVKRNSENLSDKEVNELLVLELQTKQAELDVYKSYNEKLKLIIGSRKLFTLHAAEEEFKREIINSLKEKSD